jgi:hypothetical protein
LYKAKPINILFKEEEHVQLSSQQPIPELINEKFNYEKLLKMKTNPTMFFTNLLFASVDILFPGILKLLLLYFLFIDVPPFVTGVIILNVILNLVEVH